MKIGMTYDLRDAYLAQGYGEEETAEFDRADTIDAIEGALIELGHEPVRVGNARELVARLAGGERWELVFNIAEGLHGLGREAQVPAILDAFAIPYTFSDPVTLGLALHKGFTKHVLRDAGVATAAFRVAAGPEDLRGLELGFPLFVKPVGEGTGKGVTHASRVVDERGLRAVAQELWRRFRQPVLIEEFLPGRELTVGVLGTGRDARALGTLEVVLLPGAEQDVYSYVNKERCEELVEYRLARDDGAREAEALALAAWRALDCRDGGRVDLRADARGDWHVLELNPLAGLHPEHSDLPILCTALGVPYVELIHGILDSATARLAAPAARG